MSVVTCETDPDIMLTLGWFTTSPFATYTVDIPSECDDSGWWWNSLQFPNFDLRYTTAPPSNWVGGDILLGAVPAASTLPITIGVHETDLTTLEAAKATLSAAFRQLDLTITVRVDDPTLGLTFVGQWAAFPSIIQWGQITPGMYGLFAAEGSVVVPVNPEG